MKLPGRMAVFGLLAGFCLSRLAPASAYNGRPRLIVIVVIDQFRGDYLERYHDEFGEGGFRLLIDHGANFSECNYNYANPSTAPGHATLLTGAYTDGHGIQANQWWDPQKKRRVSSVEDDATRLVGIQAVRVGASPHNLLSDTLGDELKLATQGKSRVFGISLKDRASVLSAGYAGDGAYWIDSKTGAWITSTYYRADLPKWAEDFNRSQGRGKYLNREWKDGNGSLLRTTNPAALKAKDADGADYYDVVGATPFANDYEFDFARELVTHEKLGNGAATDLLVVSLSANDILGHKVGPDSREMHAMALALDRQLADFFDFLGHQIGLANVWIALSADHGVSPAPPAAAKVHIPGANLEPKDLRLQVNHILSARLSPGHPAEYVRDFDYPLIWVNEDVFGAARIKEIDAEHDVGEALKQLGLRGYYTRSQLAGNELPQSEAGSRYAHSYSPLGGWYVLGIPKPFFVGVETGTDHASPYTYDTHVPLALYGVPFQPGTYRGRSEPVDLAVTLASLLGINAPTHASGRVLTEALAPARAPQGDAR
jgi:arylsulfatase A-like enzyme